MKTYHCIGMHLTLKVGKCTKNSRNALVGIDPIIGLGDDFKISPHITNYLVDIAYFTLAHIRRVIWMSMDNSYWYTTKDLALVQNLDIEREIIINNELCWLWTL